MIWRTMICVIAVVAVLCGCGRKDKPLDERTDLEQFFGEEFRPPKDRSVKLQARPAWTTIQTGGDVEFNVLLYNASKTPRALPLGIETPDGIVYTFLSAAIKAPDGQITSVALAPKDVQGELYAPQLGDFTSANEVVRIAPYYSFSQPGEYRVVFFYTVKDEPLPGGGTPAWIGTVWTSPTAITAE
ncbi:MAG: hypothetical protein JW889_02810 [Verrucomicrobia bacterium]|nr:hypothetical protein [Verrucomicrobiota bacterium]